MATRMVAHNVCTFCYKTVSIEDNKPTSTDIVLKFSKLLTRFTNGKLKLILEFIKSIPNSVLACCKDCDNLVSSFCKVFHGIKCLELKLLLKLESLVKVMKSADLVTSTKKQLHQCFMPDDENAEANVNCISTKNLNSFKILRSEIMRNCHQSRILPKLQPRVTLQKLAKDDVTKNICCKSYHSTMTQVIRTFGQQTFTGWLISFAALVYLVYPNNWDEIITESDFTTNLFTEDEYDVIEIETISIEGLSNSTEHIVNLCEKIVIDPILRKKSTNGYISGSGDYDAKDASVNCQEPRKESVPIIAISTPNPNNKTKQKLCSVLCSQCKMTFFHDCSLKNHMKRRHPRNRNKEQGDDGKKLSRQHRHVSIKRPVPNAAITMTHSKNDRSIGSPIEVIAANYIKFSGTIQSPLPENLCVDESEHNQENDRLSIDGTQSTGQADQIEYKIETTENWTKIGNDLEGTGSSLSGLATNSVQDSNDGNEISGSMRANHDTRQRKDTHQNIRNEEITLISPSGNEYIFGHQKLKRKHSQTSISNTKKFKCLRCGKSFRWKHVLINHLEFHKNPEEWLYECQTCGTKCPNKQSLTKHVATHGEDRSFRCYQCGKGFKLKKMFKNHLKYHENPENWKYECAHCGRKFANKYSLTRHMKVHSDEKP